MKPETVKRAIEEIKNLRQQNQMMGARLRMFDDMMSLFNTRGPERGQVNGMEDVCWQLEMQLNEDRIAVLQRVAAVNPDFIKEPGKLYDQNPPEKRAKLD